MVGGFGGLEKFFRFECCFVCDILFQFGTLCMKAEEHLWAGVVGGFHAKCTELE